MEIITGMYMQDQFILILWLSGKIYDNFSLNLITHYVLDMYESFKQYYCLKHLHMSNTPVEWDSGYFV